MAGLRKRTWNTKNGITTRWELSYVVNGVQYKKTFKKKPTPLEMAEVTQTVTVNPYLKDFIIEYINNHCRLHCKESTVETYLNYYKNALKPLYGYKLKNIKRRDLEQFILTIKAEKAAKTVNNILVFIKAFLNYAVENKILIENPSKGIKQIPLESKKVKTLNEEQSNYFLKLLKKKPIWINTFFSIMYYTGMRISECIALEWEDINNNYITVNKQFYRYRITPTKNYETRIIEMPEPLIKIISEYKKSLKGSPHGIMFSLNGKYISVNNMRERHFKYLIEEIENELNVDLSDITPHCLRHTHATYLLSNGIPLIYVSKRLGHKDCKTTLNIYNHILQSDSSKAITILNKIS